MKKINIYKFDNNVNIYYTKRRVSLPQDYRDDMEIYWKSLLKKGKKFFRGDVFSITNISYHGESMNLYTELTDYSHFLYTLNKGVFGKNDCRVIYTSALIETCDGKFVIGEMNRNTFAPKKLQFVGGGINKDDMNGDLLDLEHNIRKEVFEELGLDTYDKNIIKDFRPCFLKDGGKSNFLSAIFKLDLILDEAELLERFQKFNQGLINQGGSPELSSLMLIKAEQKSVENFINNDLREKDENLIPTLKAAVGLYKVKNFCLSE